MTDLHIVIDAMLPGDLELGMPSASLIDFGTYLKQFDKVELSKEFVSMVDKVCHEKHGIAFDQLDGMQKIQAINACKLENVKVFSEFVAHLLKAYYTTPCVLLKIGAGSVPPFPQGNPLGQDDWTILEPVYERGPIWRVVQ